MSLSTSSGDTATTPVRIAHPDPGPEGYTLLRTVQSTYRDGAE